ncbi:hypothetical protein WA1_15305 [Scytonema hofmannii PCC 7110]|uniref:CHAT domain-containing protein n=1 Tax=Scytonema hofmannii PCC 7110 TaxID=128403 RepID=A0A139XDG1_9CYAN|nr:CHAT domain-containing protein [Scytonema hofmannii]KYC42706.1 hypothetical protein WA1_15305 [Scytonema hofmannii PCC 7110]
MKKRILILSANPIDTERLCLEKEVREIQNALERFQHRDSVEIITKGAVRIDELRRTLLDKEPQFVHFSGHGKRGDGAELGRDSKELQRNATTAGSHSGGIVLENDFGQMQLVSTKSLADLFGLFKKVECVLLNACYSEEQAKAIHQHVECVIGMERAITDDAAIKFSTAFYDALGAGRNYDDAFKIGCNNIKMYGIPESLTPKIIGDGSKSLFSSNLKATELKEHEETSIMNNSPNVSYNYSVQGNNNNSVQGNNNQVSFGRTDIDERKLTKDEVINLLAELEYLVQETEIPKQLKEDVIENLTNTKKALSKAEPQKKVANGNLDTMTETLEKASKTVDACKTLWDKAKPIVVKVASWLGTAASSHLLGL